MIHLVNLSISFAGQPVLTGLNWHIGPKDVIGLIGNNGSGKTTLMKLIAGITESDEGEVVSAKSVTYGYLPQDGVVHGERSLFEEASSVFAEVRQLQAEEAELLQDMQRMDESGEDYKRVAYRYGEIHDKLLFFDAYKLDENVESVLVGLGFSHEDLGRQCNEFSGGWQMRIALAKVLLSKPNLLLLDEPTNYLDIEARTWLQNWLAAYPHAILLVSHDRYFLDHVVNRVTEIHDGKLSDYHCNYTRYLVEREERVARLMAEARRVEEERQRIQAFIDRFRYKADKAPMVQSRVKMLEKLKKIDLPSVRKSIKFNFPQPSRSGKIALEAENLTAGYGDGPDILRNVEFQVARGERIALVGVNGAGKTTLMKVISDQLAPRKGGVHFGYNVEYDYFAQDLTSQLDMSATVYQTLERSCPFDLVPRLRNLLGAFLFSGDDIDKTVSVLSGGERNRLVLARMLLAPSNLLLLDEPTNHLDIDAKEILLKALLKFEGTILFVSHDRYFLDRLARKVYALEDGELSVFPGSYPEFLDNLKRRGLSVDGPGKVEENPEQVAAAKEKAVAKKERVDKWREDKKRQRERQRLERKVAELEEEIAAKEQGSANLMRQMAEPQYSTNFSELEKLSELKNNLDAEIADLTKAWEKDLVLLEKLSDTG